MSSGPVCSMRVAGPRCIPSPAVCDCRSPIIIVCTPEQLHAGAAGGNGATVMQLGGGTRELYYYPKDTMLVINVGENVNKGMQQVQQLLGPTKSLRTPVSVQLEQALFPERSLLVQHTWVSMSSATTQCHIVQLQVASCLCLPCRTLL